MYLLMLIKHWQYVVIAFLFVLCITIGIRCYVLSDSITEQELKHSIEIYEIRQDRLNKEIEMLNKQNEAERRINEVIEKYENTKSINTVKTETIIKEQLQPIINQFNSECFSSEWLSEQNSIIRIYSDSNTDDK